ncbi:MAG: hypothetical protein R3293_23960, partial [Candidatus Promineifilaceae bacterium]|nr:hypothetical protein [Candidatus Promineifilaceae bacterium]
AFRKRAEGVVRTVGLHDHVAGVRDRRPAGNGRKCRCGFHDDAVCEAHAVHATNVVRRMAIISLGCKRGRGNQLAHRSRAIDNTPGAYEVVYAYDNLLGALPAQATVGVENAAGDEATALVNNGAVAGTISNGFMVCFDAVVPVSEVTITYQATVDADAPLGVLWNDAISMTSNPGSESAAAKSGLYIGYPTFMPVAVVPASDES